jgi:uncharacterized membrane-anchored protein
MNKASQSLSIPILNKVPEVTLWFWIIKILSTTVGETVADYLAVEVGFGQTITSGTMFLFLAIALSLQLRVKRYVPWAYWLTVVLVSVVGTQITDILTDKLDVSLYVSSAIFSVILTATFTVWYRKEGTLSIQSINTHSREFFYWAAILCTFALGTATGDLATEALGLGFKVGILAFGFLIGAAAVAYYMGFGSVLTFWTAYVFTRPLGAALGDWLTQEPTYGGLGLGAQLTSILFLSVIVVLVGIAQRNSNRT